MTESRLYGATIAFECSKMKAKILELSKMALFQVDTYINILTYFLSFTRSSQLTVICKSCKIHYESYYFGIIQLLVSFLISRSTIMRYISP